MKLLLIKWVDSYGVGQGWRPLSGISEKVPHLVATSVGFEAYRDDKVIVLIPHTTAETENCEEQGCGDMAIPISAIVSEDVLTIECTGTTGTTGTTPPDTDRDVLLRLTSNGFGSGNIYVTGAYSPMFQAYQVRVSCEWVSVDQSKVKSWEEIDENL